MFIWWNKCTFNQYNIFISLNMFASEICDIHFNACKHIYCLDGLVFFRTDNIQKQAFNDLMYMYAISLAISIQIHHVFLQIFANSYSICKTLDVQMCKFP